MPLASRATQARAERAGAAAETPSETQPRKKPEAPPEPSAALPAMEAATTPTDAGKRRGRPPGTPRAAKAPTAAAGDAKQLRTRQKEIEKEFKDIAREQLQALRAHEQKFRERRSSLESEHRLIAGQLSSKIFNG